MALINNAKTTRNLSQFAEKKLVGRAHTRADRSDLEEGIPSGMQLSTQTIFGDSVPNRPADNLDQIALWGIHSGGKVQKVELVATVISGTDYEADASTDKGGNDSQVSGPHAYQLKMHSSYVSNSSPGGNPVHSKVDVEPFKNDKRIFDTMGALQIVPDNMWLDPTFATVNNPYTPVIYVKEADGTLAGTLGPTHAIDWFFDPFSGIIFLQDYDPDVIPYKVECFIYIGDMADQTTGGATTLNGLSDVDAGSPTNGHALVYNSSTGNWESQAQSGGGSGGITRFEYVQSSGTTTAKTAITVNSSDMFNGSTPTMADTKVYLNGQLLIGGTDTQLTSDEVDYHLVSGGTQIKMVDAVQVNDVISIYHTTTSFSTGKDILLHTDDAAFDNARVITGGDGITITKPSSPNQRTLLVTNSGLIQRTKEYFTGLTHSSNEFTFAFAGSTNFSYNSHADDRIDVYVNGVLKEKGYDYNFVDDGSGGLEDNKIEWLSNTAVPSNTDRFTIIIF
tara:strand:- start:1276 stop:2793 length:1518 start_codon:yes stop_codon:yes gene_type:complete